VMQLMWAQEAVTTITAEKAEPSLLMKKATSVKSDAPIGQLARALLAASNRERRCSMAASNCAPSLPLMPQAGQPGAVRDPRQHQRDRSVLLLRAQPPGETEG
jgi:hypothetical protein